MRIVVTGATGNVGTSVLPALARDGRVDEIVGVARRLPRWEAPKVRWAAADIVSDDLATLFAGADVVIHLAWLIQPSRDGAKLRAVNVEGSRRVFEGAAAAGVPRLVHASSVGTYSSGPSDAPVNEAWPHGGIRTSFYSRHKAEAEAILDRMEGGAMRIVRLRPALIFKRDAASGIRRLFAGPLLPSPLLRPGLLPVLPLPRGLVVQGVHSHDVAEAYRLAALEPNASGAYNVAAEPVLDARRLAGALGARPLPVPVKAVRAAAALSWRAGLQPTPPGWLDLGMGVPRMDTRRIREELHWRERYGADAALRELVDGMRESAGFPTPPLDPQAGGRGRAREFPPGGERGAP